MATGIRRRHSKGCASVAGRRCDCKAGWEASVFLKREGKKIRKTFTKESEARAWRSEAITAAAAGKLKTATTLTVTEAAWLWLEAADTGAVRDRAGKVFKPSTLRSYRSALRLRVLKEFGAVRLSELRRGDVQAFVDRLLGEGKAPSTIANTLDPLRAIYRHAIRRELVAVNPTAELELPAADGRRERIASPSEAAALVAVVAAADRPLWATAFYAGLRRGELQALRWSDVDLGRSEIHVRRSWDEEAGAVEPKSKAGVRTVPILGVLRDHLDTLKATGRPAGDDLVFGSGPVTPFPASSVSKRARAAFKASPLKAITLHECRHTFASLLIHAGVNAKAIQTFMGHATIQMTFDQYGHLMPGSRDQARELVDAYLDAAIREARIEASCAGDAPAASVAERLAASEADDR
ncbi:MAG TPA: site-specific integrase [Solirubrobacterales bacterium]|jgi:integrase|nr:site-specific integrase [Solirubrobacterales bacterium]